MEKSAITLWGTRQPISLTDYFGQNSCVPTAGLKYVEAN